MGFYPRRRRLKIGFRLLLKRIIDICGAIVGLILLSPLLLVIALGIKLTSRGKVLFRQERVGLYGKVFVLYKFRSMVMNADKKGAGLFFSGADDHRITPFGRFLRNTSLDELPELWNVLLGQMSLIGPRPVLTITAEGFDELQRERFAFRPGITGWAQVNGRNSLTWPQRAELDLWYIQNYSLSLDFRILLKTVKVVLAREGIRYDQKKDDVWKQEKP